MGLFLGSIFFDPSVFEVMLYQRSIWALFVSDIFFIYL